MAQLLEEVQTQVAIEDLERLADAIFFYMGMRCQALHRAFAAGTRAEQRLPRQQKQKGIQLFRVGQGRKLEALTSP